MATVKRLNREVAAGSEWLIEFPGMTSRKFEIIVDSLETTLLS